VDGAGARRGTVGRQLAVDAGVEFGVGVQSQHQPTAAIHHGHAARPESLPAVVRHVVVRAAAAGDAAPAASGLRARARVVDYDIIIIIVIVIGVVDLVVLAVILRRSTDAAAAAKERSERIADLRTDVRVGQIETDVNERA